MSFVDVFEVLPAAVNQAMVLPMNGKFQHGRCLASLVGGRYLRVTQSAVSTCRHNSTLLRFHWIGVAENLQDCREMLEGNSRDAAAHTACFVVDADVLARRHCNQKVSAAAGVSARYERSGRHPFDQDLHGRGDTTLRVDSVDTAGNQHREWSQAQLQQPTLQQPPHQLQ